MLNGWVKDETHVIYLMYSFILLTYAISLVHLLLALISILVGIISQSRALVWMAHSVSPIWSGIFVSKKKKKKSKITVVVWLSLQFVEALVLFVPDKKVSMWWDTFFFFFLSHSICLNLDIMLCSIKFSHNYHRLCKYSIATFRFS